MKKLHWFKKKNIKRFLVNKPWVPVLIFAIVGSSLYLITKASSPQIGTVVTSTIYSQPGFNGFPAMERLKNGDLLIVFRHGSSAIGSDGSLVIGRSTDNGYNWSFNGLYDRGATDDRVNVGLKQLSDGTLLLPFVEANVNGYKNYTYILKSTDNGYTWSAPIPVPNPNSAKWLFAYGKIVEFSDKLIMPAYQRMNDYSLPPESVLMSSTDKGQTWKLFSTIAYSSTVWWNETALVATSSSNWLAFVRQDGNDPSQRIYQYKTTDTGGKWTNYNLTPQISPDALVLASGHLMLCVGGQRGSGIATTIKCQFTLDSGTSWVGAKDIFTGGGDGGYPSTVQLGNGDILTAFYQSTNGNMNIAVARYREDGGAPALPPVPSITLYASSSSVSTNSTLNISWSATNSPSVCNASGTWSGAKSTSSSLNAENRSADTSTAGTKTYTLTCSNSGGSSSKSVSVTVNNPPSPPPPPPPTATAAPVVSISASNGSVMVNAPLSVSWKATNSPTSCSASGTWSGAKPASGSENRTGDTASAGAKSYSLTCSNSGGSHKATVNVTVNSPPPAIPTTPGNLKIVTSTSSTINLSWDASSGTIEYYTILWSSNKATTKATAYQVSGLAGCRTYTFTVSAHNSGGDSVASKPVSGSTTGCSTGTAPPPPPPPPACTTCGQQITSFPTTGPVTATSSDTPDGTDTTTETSSTEEAPLANGASSNESNKSAKSKSKLGIIGLLLVFILLAASATYGTIYFLKRRGNKKQYGNADSDSRWPGDV